MKSILRCCCAIAVSILAFGGCSENKSAQYPNQPENPRFNSERGRFGGQGGRFESAEQRFEQSGQAQQPGTAQPMNEPGAARFGGGEFGTRFGAQEPGDARFETGGPLADRYGTGDAGAPRIGTEAGRSGLAAPVKCPTARNDISMLESEKASVSAQAFPGIRPEMRSRLNAAKERYNSDIDAKIGQIKQSCGL